MPPPIPIRSSAATARSSTIQVLIATQPIGISTCISVGSQAPRRPKARRESTICGTPVRCPMTLQAPNSAHPNRLPTTMTVTVSTRLSPSWMPSAPSTQLIGAMFAPAQIQNWSS